MKANEAPQQYIPKSAVVAEIEKLYNGEIDTYTRNILDRLKSNIDTIEVKELLTWQDIKLISEIGEDFMNSEDSDNLNDEEYYTEILNRFKAEKGEEE